jgi:putative endonuclease
MKLGYVYILRSQKNNRFYIGSTDNIDKRLKEHNLGKSKYTSESGPWKIVFQQEFGTLKLARQVEIKLKKLKNKNVLEKIINKGKIFLSCKMSINW